MKTTVKSGTDSRYGEWYRVSGSEFISVVTQPANTTAGTIIFSRANDVAPPNTRLAQLANLYERWEPFRYEYEFIPSVPTTTPGSLMSAIDVDPVRTYPDTADTLSALRVLRGSCLQQVWQPFRVRLPSEHDYTSLWCSPATTTVGDPEDRLTSAGRLWIASSIPTSASLQTLGQLVLHYDILFHLPRIRTNTTSSSFEAKIPVTTGAGGLFEGVAAGSPIALTGKVVSMIKESFGSSGNSSTGDIVDELSRLIREVKAWTSADLLNPRKQIDDFIRDNDSNDMEVAGMPHGIYRFDYTLASNDVFGALTLAKGTGDPGGYNATAYYNLEGEYVANESDFVGFDGITHSFHSSWGTEFAIDSIDSRGFSDYNFTKTAVEFPQPVYLYVRFNWYSPSVFFSNLTGSNNSARKKKGKKLPALIPMSEGHGDKFLNSRRSIANYRMMVDSVSESKSERIDSKEEDHPLFVILPDSKPVPIAEPGLPVKGRSSGFETVVTSTPPTHRVGALSLTVKAGK